MHGKILCVTHDRGNRHVQHTGRGRGKAAALVSDHFVQLISQCPGLSAPHASAHPTPAHVYMHHRESPSLSVYASLPMGCDATLVYRGSVGKDAYLEPVLVDSLQMALQLPAVPLQPLDPMHHVSSGRHAVRRNKCKVFEGDIGGFFVP